MCAKMESTKGVPGHLMLPIGGVEMYEGEIFEGG